MAIRVTRANKPRRKRKGAKKELAGTRATGTERILSSDRSLKARSRAAAGPMIPTNGKRAIATTAPSPYGGCRGQFASSSSHGGYLLRSSAERADVIAAA